MNKAKGTIPNTRASVPQSSIKAAGGTVDPKAAGAKRKDTADETTAGKGKEDKKNETALLKGVRDR